MPISEAASSINKPDTINNLTTEYINDTILRLAQIRGIYEGVLKNIGVERMHQILDYINMDQDYLEGLSQSHRFATFCKAMYIVLKEDKDMINEVFNNLNL
jgi:hypothetical protein